MFKVIKAVLCAAVCVLVYSCATDQVAGSLRTGRQAPDWVYSVPADYPDSAYLTAVGYASTREGAESNAVASVGRTIRQTIQAQTVAQEGFTQSDGNYSTNTAFSGTVNTSADLQNISGVTIKEVWNDGKGTVYAFAVLDRNESGRFYRTQIEKNAEVINSQILYASDNAESFEAVGALGRATKLAEENAESLNILSAVNPMMYRLVSLDYGSAEKVREFSQQIFERIQIAIVISGDKNNLVGSAFAEAITAVGISPQFAQTGVYPYVLKVNVIFEDVGLVGNYQAVRYVVDTALTDVRNSKVLLPLTISGRESHINQQEAQTRAYRTIQSEVAKQFAPRFAALIQSY
jgi:hypothetical protein